MDEVEHFNLAITNFLNENEIDIDKCRFQAVRHLETEVTNLHSFFIKDLEKAKWLNTPLLNNYIFGRETDRINLDSRKESTEFNPHIFNAILQPKNYPSARFPSNPKFYQSFMQQVAINLAIGFDNKKIRSVNGPPGTGKTTLLRDIFAELVVEQAYEMTKLPQKYLKGTEATKYWDHASIGIMPRSIADKGIVVASSNNGAVQNIVNELPLNEEIDEAFLEAILKVDYFKEIANSKVSVDWEDDGNTKPTLTSKKLEEDHNWGLFSLQGGTKTNMDYISAVLQHVHKYFKEEYLTDEAVYEAFSRDYQIMADYRDKRQEEYDTYLEISHMKTKIYQEKELFTQEKAFKHQTVKKIEKETDDFIESKRKEIKKTSTKIEECVAKLDHQKLLINNTYQKIDAQKLKKPGFLSRLFNDENMQFYNEKLKEYSDELQHILKEENNYLHHKESLAKANLIRAKEMTDKEKDKIKAQADFEHWCQNKEKEITGREEQLYALSKKIQNLEFKGIDFTVDYETLQLSNPWDDIEYRKLQSHLFISALKVRKQFLYDNRNNIQAAFMIWNKQNGHLERKQVIEEAWNWINLVIPVIGSTFASIARMCANLSEETIGHLFIDEAGQALPQASVGAIFRSKNVMAVGDPSQIKPVLTLDSSVLGMLRKHFNVHENYLSEDASTQTLIDNISQYGFYKVREQEQEEWIGIPLWVHRRCKHPMFDISNSISYGGNMVQGKNELGDAEWIQVSGHASDKYVKEQGIALKEKILELSKANLDIMDHNKEDIVYVISPFRNVAYQLTKELETIGFTRKDSNKKVTNVGTVHTFQGKEAPIVFLVLGADERSRGAANWAMGTDHPNIMNVAATRAKEAFYIIGDQALYLELNSDVVNETSRIITEYNHKFAGGILL